MKICRDKVEICWRAETWMPMKDAEVVLFEMAPILKTKYNQWVFSDLIGLKFAENCLKNELCHEIMILSKYKWVLRATSWISSNYMSSGERVLYAIVQF